MFLKENSLEVFFFLNMHHLISYFYLLNIFQKISFRLQKRTVKIKIVFGRKFIKSKRKKCFCFLEPTLKYELKFLIY